MAKYRVDVYYKDALWLGAHVVTATSKAAAIKRVKSMCGPGLRFAARLSKRRKRVM